MPETVDQRVIWDEVKVGDPRPPKHRSGMCMAFAHGWCTRLHGHTGQHVATGPDRVLAVWEGEHQ